MATEKAGTERTIDAKKGKALDMALSNIEKQFGKGSVVRLGQSMRLQVDSISTGSIALDMALGVGGVPRGRITEIYGTESSGKTTIALQVVAQAQKKGGTCAYVDVEHAIDPEYARVRAVLERGYRGSFLDLELSLWSAIRDAVDQEPAAEVALSEVA